MRLYNMMPNLNRLECDGITVWFSYQTPVAFYTRETGTVVRENDWGPTPGKHLNRIEPDKASRISGRVFENLLGKVWNDNE